MSAIKSVSSVQNQIRCYSSRNTPDEEDWTGKISFCCFAFQEDVARKVKIMRWTGEREREVFTL